MGDDRRTSVRAGMLTFVDGGGAYVALTNPPWRYVIYSAIGKGWGTKSGIAVEKDGILVSNHPCPYELVSELGPDLFRKVGIPDDHEGFDLPG